VVIRLEHFETLFENVRIKHCIMHIVLIVLRYVHKRLKFCVEVYSVQRYFFMNRGVGNWYKSIRLIKIAKENFPIININRLIFERSSSRKKCVYIKERK
jgi:hypothetical protein